MAEVMASAATGLITSLLGKLASLLGDEYTLLHEVRGDVEFLQRELSGMDDLLERLVEMEKNGHGTKKWRVKLRELAYEVEDGIDSFTHNLGSAHDRAGFVRGYRQKLNLMVHHQVAKQIKELKEQIEEESARHKRYNLHLDGSSVNTIVGDEIDCRVKALYVDPDHQLVGMDGPVASIMELLTLEEDESSAKQLQIVSIYGPGGLGKTTLANQVHRRIKGQFDYAALVSVSQKPNLKDILTKMAPSVIRTDRSCSFDSTWQLLENVKDFLQDKRYLIVFDDIWSTEIWKHLKSVLPRNNKKSRVITTTRMSDVASSCSSQSNDHIYIMKSLSDADSKELFSKIIFDHKGKCPKALDEIADKILKKCGGIPLAIITLASLLAKKPKTRKEWKRVKSSIGNACELHGMRQTLCLSIYDLSYDLRNCFLSLGTFPEDYEIDRERLVLRWIAEGFISGKEQLELEQKGDNYFNELVNRSLIQPIDIQYNGSARACRVHDLMLELIVSMSKEEKFIITLNGPECLPISGKIRWLSLHSNEHEVMQVVTDNRQHVRSVSFFPPVAQLPPCLELKAMRVFDVKGCQFGEHKKMKNIASLIQLKYLNLADTNVKELPKEIGELHFLETLDVRNCPIQSLPPSLCRLQKLVRLFVSLGVTLPDKIGKMQALEELSHVAILCNSLNFVEALGELSKLRVFRVDCRYSWLNGKKQAPRQSVSKYEDALLSCLRNLCKENLQSLEINLTDGSSLVFSLMNPYCPFPQLEELVISNFISRVPRGMGSLKDVIHLEIKLDRMEEEDLHIIRDMSASLLFLRIDLERTPEERLIIDAEGFECLKQFAFCCAGMGLKFVQGAMPDLEKLDLDIGVRKTMSKYGGFDFGIKNLEALKHVCVKLDCQHAGSEEIKSAEDTITKGVLPRRIMPQIQRIGEDASILK
uniref:AAA+ ATPase domain-containing protein n=1 Tax=Oryza punctata TaxID=4537 RepID=A0A0E0LUK1_ORYPU